MHWILPLIVAFVAAAAASVASVFVAVASAVAGDVLVAAGSSSLQDRARYWGRHVGVTDRQTTDSG